ncbi:4-hydroxy-3-methylbut-2-enyl diphosphate reductase [Oxalobacteraceae bacterium GrIS 2.11]|uniref:4-hydroxy-3-methylbut-2-enyl diphosphate reductase n=1 Tax=Undibacterium sp. GrIS 1.8 TaxID=3143934 RepID=UPI003394D518
MNSEILLAQPRGFCAGVERAIAIVERALTKFGAPIYVRHEIVHNAYVVNELRNKGAVFVNELHDIPNGSNVIFSAHGVSKAVQDEADRRGLKVFDATCPLVSKVHIEVEKMRREGREIIMIGHEGHPEVEGTMGQSKQGMYLVETVRDVEKPQVTNPGMLAYVSQTTLSIEDTVEIIRVLKHKYPSIAEPKKGDICYATTNRQEAVKFMAPQVDLVIVIGSQNSSNSKRLREVAEKNWATAYMVDSAEQIDPAWMVGKIRVGVTAGASAPEILVQLVIDRLKDCGAKSVRTLDGVEERITFPLPMELSRRQTTENLSQPNT